MRHLISLALLLLVAAPLRAAPPPDKELVLLVLIDAVRADAVGSYGYTRPTTPFLDALAAESQRYTRAYVNAPWTRPSTASYLTGLNASRHRTQSAKSKLPVDATSLAQRLREAGWRTSGFTANGNGGSLAGLERGFDTFEDPTNTYTKAARGTTYNGLPSAQFLTRRVLDHLAGSAAKKEFVFIFYVDPHDPYGAPPELERMFLGDFKGVVRRKATWESNNDYPADERFSMRAIYDAGIRNADAGIQELVEGLRRMGVWKNTTMFVSADHGEGFGEHGFYLHAHHFWEEVIHVPLLARGPRIQPGVSSRLTQSLDVTATILDHAGASRTGLSGNSLYDAAPARPRVISEYNEFGIRRQAIMDGRYKIVWQRPANEEEFLREAKNKALFPSVVFDRETIHAFDVEADPGERRDLAQSMPLEATTLMNELRGFVEKSESVADRR